MVYVTLAIRYKTNMSVFWMGVHVNLVEFAGICRNIMHGRRKYMKPLTQNLYDYLQNIRIEPNEKEKYAWQSKELKVWQVGRIYNYLKKNQTALDAVINPMTAV